MGQVIASLDRLDCQLDSSPNKAHIRNEIGVVLQCGREGDFERLVMEFQEFLHFFKGELSDAGELTIPNIHAALLDCDNLSATLSKLKNFV